MKITLTDKLITSVAKAGISIKHLLVYKWLLNKRIIGKKTTVYYSDFLKWYRKYGGEISDRHASRLFRQLEEKGLAKVVGRGFGRFEVTLFDLYFALGLKCASSTDLSNDEKSQDSDLDSNRGDNSSDEGGLQQQHKYNNQESKSKVQVQVLIKAKELLDRIGIKYREDSVWWEIASHGLKKIEETIKLYQFKELKKPGDIWNPPGWFRNALRDDYWMDVPFYSLSGLFDLTTDVERCWLQCDRRKTS